MKSMVQCLSIFVLFASCGVGAKHLDKRQIYREQVLPHAGGKIPDSAFQVDRLALNKLQKEGIAIPDGFQLEPREFQVYPYNQRTRRPTFHAALKPSNRFTSSVGEYHFNEMPSIETTYAVPQISGHPLNLPPKIPAIPVLTNPLKIPSNQNYIGNPAPRHQGYKLIFDVPHKFYQPAPQQLLTYPESRPLSLLHNAPSRQNQQYIGTGPIQTPVVNPLHWSNFQQDYVTSALFNDFETFFKDYAHQRRLPYLQQRGIRDVEKDTKTPISNIDVKNNKNNK